MFEFQSDYTDSYLQSHCYAKAKSSILNERGTYRTMNS